MKSRTTATAVGGMEEYVARAVAKRPEVLAAMAQVQQARHATRAAQSEYIPDIAVFARQTYQDAVAFIPRTGVSGGIQASWNVFDFGRRSAAVDQPVATRQLAEENLARVRDQVALEVEKAYRNVVRADRLVQVARQAAVLARRDAERIAGGRTTAGLVLASASKEAVANRSAAESSLVEAELGAHIARAELMRAVGGR